MEKKYLNLGCGNRYLKEWTNLDFVKTGPEVVACNLSEGIPFPDSSFDVVYHSHVLEHFARDTAVNFIRECYRVLKPGGIIRVAVPDLEQIVKEYLKNLDRALGGDRQGKADYEWIMLELFDQIVRTKPGGDMAAYWTRTVIPNENYLSSRLGHEFRMFRKKFGTTNPLKFNNGRAQSLKKRLIEWLPGGKQLSKYIELGKFRSGGEIHQWMYDRYSLGMLLRDSGFGNIADMDAFHSQIPGWETYRWLDVEEGVARKPDSLFMEATK